MRARVFLGQYPSGHQLYVERGAHGYMLIQVDPTIDETDDTDVDGTEIDAARREEHFPIRDEMLEFLIKQHRKHMRKLRRTR